MAALGAGTWRTKGTATIAVNIVAIPSICNNTRGADTPNTFWQVRREAYIEDVYKSCADDSCVTVLSTPAKGVLATISGGSITVTPGTCIDDGTSFTLGLSGGYVKANNLGACSITGAPLNCEQTVTATITG